MLPFPPSDTSEYQTDRFPFSGKMVKSFSFLPFFFFLFIIASSQAKSIVQHPQPSSSFKIQDNQSTHQNVRSCSYTVTIRTSCSSTSYTRDRISLAFGDAYGNQVYAPRLDDPSTGTFERCSTDTYKISGPCTYQICYVYLLRTGYDGWKPESVKISSPYVNTITFYYNTFLPNGVWFGFNLCNDLSTTAAM
ncbi:PREDICTED: uncharacterized protein LOC104592430 [Nelumbo nucifera]|uniref:Uncharacterized protein LOC104592430 n=1 Tax=Nelumbo nucifera TaxID=4432 RepID=A0A1U7ZBQ4_NELNU|nr:PREDICTED: uncharacterized protein LOC104592430 [Nelumbo nucifera]